MEKRHPSYIQLLPVEILGEIFCHHFVLMNCRTLSSFPLSHVCSRWRNAAIGVPVLWSDITIADSSYPGALPFTNLLLSRSSETFLHISTDLSSSEIVDLLVRHVSRWRSVRFRLDITGNWKSIEDLVREDLTMPHLEEFYFESDYLNLIPGWSRVSTPLYPLEVLFLKNAARLSTFHWHVDDLNLRNIVVPAKIRNLSVRWLGLNDACRFLDRYPALESAVLSINPWSPTNLFNHDDIPRASTEHGYSTHPALSQLDLYCIVGGGPADHIHVQEIFDAKVYPHLTKLRLYSVGSLFGIDTILHLGSSLALCAPCELTELVLNGVAYRSEQLKTIFELCPKLKKVDLWDNYLCDPDFFFKMEKDLIERLTFPLFDTHSEEEDHPSEEYSQTTRSVSRLPRFAHSVRSPFKGMDQSLAAHVPKINVGPSVEPSSSPPLPPLLPHLTELRIFLAEAYGPDQYRIQYRLGFDLDHFIGMLESRCQEDDCVYVGRDISKLKKLDIGRNWEKNLTGGFVERLKKMQYAGLDIGVWPGVSNGNY